MYKSVIRPLLFLLQPEQAHRVTVGLLKFVMALPLVKSVFRSQLEVTDPNLKRKLFGLTFKSPVGLAAGFDK
ncbi:MAG: dihydroorotate dehydrogenase (quinone), partial [Bacteroidota bacterium]